jgi:hypothetical protein
MASAEWVEIYGGYAPDELDAEPAALKEQQQLYTSQSVGSKSYTFD